jgi:hypothetical protein
LLEDPGCDTIKTVGEFRVFFRRYLGGSNVRDIDGVSLVALAIVHLRPPAGPRWIYRV